MLGIDSTVLAHLFSHNELLVGFGDPRSCLRGKGQDLTPLVYFLRGKGQDLTPLVFAYITEPLAVLF